MDKDAMHFTRVIEDQSALISELKRDIETLKLENSSQKNLNNSFLETDQQLKNNIKIQQEEYEKKTQDMRVQYEETIKNLRDQLNEQKNQQDKTPSSLETMLKGDVSSQGEQITHLKNNITYCEKDRTSLAPNMNLKSSEQLKQNIEDLQDEQETQLKVRDAEVDSQTIKDLQQELFKKDQEIQRINLQNNYFKLELINREQNALRYFNVNVLSRNSQST